MEFKETLKHIRKANHLTQKQLANVIEISVTGYASWEQGKSEPNIDMLIKLADYFNCTIDELVGRE